MDPRVPCARFRSAVLVLATGAVFSATYHCTHRVVFNRVLRQAPTRTSARVTNAIREGANVIRLVNRDSITAVDPRKMIRRSIVMRRSFQSGRLRPQLLRVIRLIPFRNMFLAVFRQDGCHLLSLRYRTSLKSVSRHVSRHVSGPMETFFISIRRSTVTIKYLRRTGTITQLCRELRMLAIYPQVSVTILLVNGTICHATRSFLTIRFRGRHLRTVFVLRSIRVVMNASTDAGRSPNSGKFHEVYQGDPSHLLTFRRSFSQLEGRRSAFNAQNDLILRLIRRRERQICVFIHDHLCRVRVRIQAREMSNISTRDCCLANLRKVFVKFKDGFRLPAFFLMLRIFGPTNRVTRGNARVTICHQVAVIVDRVRRVTQAINGTSAQGVSINRDTCQLTCNSANLRVRSTVGVINACLTRIAKRNSKRVGEQNRKNLIYVNFLNVTTLRAAGGRRGERGCEVFRVLCDRCCFGYVRVWGR